MIVTTYTCDRCGHSQTGEGNLWTVRVQVGPGVNHQFNHYDGNKLLWCRPCIEFFNNLLSLFRDAKPSPDAPPPPTIDDMIREIVREELPG